MQQVSQNNPQKYNLYSGLVVLTVTKINQKKLKAYKNSRRQRVASDLLPIGWKRAARFLQIIPRPTTKIEIVWRMSVPCGSIRLVLFDDYDRYNGCKLLQWLRQR